jgi:surfeit locus 1 family protein
VTRRRLWLVVLAAIAAVACVRLGFWQLDRLEDRRAANARILRGMRAAPLTLEAVPTAAAAYRRASAQGTYDAGETVVLYGRPLEGNPGDHVLTPLRLGDGSALLVDRGWIPIGANLPVPPEQAHVEGILLPPESDEGLAPAGDRVRSVDIAGIGSRLPYRLAPVYLLLQREEPSDPAPPIPAPLPELSEGPHLSYAIQWFSFAGVAIVGAAVVLRGDRRAGDRRTGYRA